MFHAFTKVISCIAVLMMLSGCAFNQHQTAGNGTVTSGVVLQAHNVSVASNAQSIGFAAVGGVLGSLLANTAAKKLDWSARAAISIIGATIGAGAANVTAKSSGLTPGQEIIVVTQDRKTISITQPLQEGQVLTAGDTVYIVQEGRNMRARKVDIASVKANSFIAGFDFGRHVSTFKQYAKN